MIYSKRFMTDNLMTEFINESILTKDDIISVIFDEKYRSYVLVFEVADCVGEEVCNNKGINSERAE